jgi:hypothetical protein
MMTRQSSAKPQGRTALNSHQRRPQKTRGRRIPPTEQQIREELLRGSRGQVAGGVIAQPDLKNRS